jgi:hypothetical protein
VALSDPGRLCVEVVGVAVPGRTGRDGSHGDNAQGGEEARGGEEAQGGGGHENGAHEDGPHEDGVREDADGRWRVHITNADVRDARARWLAAYEGSAPDPLVDLLYQDYVHLVSAQAQQLADDVRRR